jgi:predicted phage terminase large subunit-like protein
VQSWDTASKATELSDFSVGTSWRILGKDLYLIDVLRRRLEYPELKRAVRAQYELFRPSVVLIEDKASGTQLIQELVAEGLYAVTRYQPLSDKVTRMHAQTAMIENGFVHLPDAAPWLAQYLHELTSFPKGRHDDQVDSTAQMLDWFKRGSGPSSDAGIFELCRHWPKRRAPRRRAPNRCRQWQAARHPPLAVTTRLEPAGTIEMSETDAMTLSRAGWVRVEDRELGHHPRRQAP